MILVDTSVWIDFFRRGTRGPWSALRAELEAVAVVTHPLVIGELALGTLGRHRASALADLRRLPPTTVLTDSEVHALIERHKLDGSGIGWMDAHLLGSALVDRVDLWTADGRLARVARSLGVTLRGP